jgi:hypothetical protein
VSSTPHDSATGLPAARQQVAAWAAIGAALMIAVGFAYMAVESFRQFDHVAWRLAEIPRMVSAGASLATAFPVRFVFLVLGSVAVMLAAEYRPRGLVRVSTAVWVSAGVAGTGAYLLSTLDAGTRWAFTLLLGASVVVAVLVARLSLLQPEDRGRFTRPEGSARRRPVLPVAVGLVGGLLAVRASIEPVTEWDALIYHVSFARDWIASLPGLPHAVGPSVGAELSYNYPALFPSINVAFAGALHVGVSSVARIISPLAAITVLAVLRAVGPSALFPGWAGPMFLLGSTFFVAYGAWPTAYMLMTVLIVLAVTRLVVERRLTLATALCIGLAAETGLIGIAFAVVVLVAFFGVWLARRSPGRTDRHVPSASSAVGAVGAAVLVAAPLGVVVVGSLQRTGGVLFPWLTWPRAADLLPSLYWKASEHEILANSYGQFGAAVGSFDKALVGIAGSGLLAPGGIALQLLIVAACAVAYDQRRGALLAGVAVLAGAVVLFVALELVWLRYFVPMSVAAAAGLGAAVGALRERRGGRVELIAYSAAVVAACLSVASGVAYALAGPNDRTYTAKIDYRMERYSPFEEAGQAANSRKRRLLVYGDDSRAWDDIDRLDAAGVGVGTFDIRNYYAPYVPRLQLDGLAGAAITGTTGAEVARQLKSRHIDAVFVPSWFWEPGAARHPLADRSPVASWVGVPALRAVRVYLPDPYVTYPSVLYIVGSTLSARRRVSSLVPSPTFSVAGALSTRRSIVRRGFAVSGPLGGPLHWRIAAPVTEIGGPSIRLTTNDLAAGRGLSVYEPRAPTLVNPAAFVDCARVAPWARESTLDVAFPGSPLGFALLDVGVGTGTRAVKAVVRGLPASTKILVRACGDPTSRRGGVFPAGSTAGRIVVEHRRPGPLALAFDYLDAGRRAVSFNLYDEARARWLYGVAGLDRCGSGRWLHAQLTLRDLPTAAATPTAELGPFVNGDDLTVRNLRLVEGSTRQAPRC